MKNMTLRILSFLLVVIMLISTTVISVSAESDVYDPTSQETKKLGFTFDSSTTAKMDNILPALPYTYEAEVQLSTASRGGVILGNYSGYGKCISFEIHEQGRPRLYVANGSNATSIIFNNVSIISDDIVKLAITVDEANGMAHCYLNGELKQSLAFDYSKIGSEIPTERPLMVGGDYRTGNSTPFLGQIKSVYAYSDMRTSEEIAQGSSLTDENLLVAYEFMSSGVKNLSGYEGYDLTTTDWKMDIIGENALTFTADNTYQVMKPFDQAILTYEAQIYFPKSNDTSTRGGVVLGNYYSSWGANCVNFEFKEKGSPRLYYEINGIAYDFHFSNVDARLDRFVFVTVTLDPTTGEAKCYLDGELKQTITKGAMTVPDAVYKNEMCLGRDSRGASGYPFKGAIKSLAVYSDVRTADEIKADIVAFDKEADGLLAMYEFSKETGRSDISGNCYHICYNGEAKPDDTSNPSTPDVPAPDTPSVPTEINGLTFASGDYAIVQKNFPVGSSAYTFEAFIYLPTTVTDRGGVILGNYKDSANHYFNFEIYSGGVPRISGTYANNLNSRFDYQFSAVDVRGNDPVHLAITLDMETGVAVCYVNGVAKQTITKNNVSISPSLNDNKMILGNDLRTSDNQHFRGTIGSVAVYTDVRTAAEIALDAEAISLESDNLELYYDLSTATKGEDIADLTGNGYNVKFGNRILAETADWFTEKESVTDYIYSFAVVGDTQIIARNYANYFGQIYDWILDNKDSKKIGYVFGLGDITDGNSANEWSLASTHVLGKLTGVIPYSVVRGNHDGASNFNSVFAVDSYMSQFDGFYKENDVTNTYRLFDIQGAKYLLITLDYGASDQVLEWAGNIIEANPDRRVIITTHAYLYRDGTTLDQGDVCPPATTGGYNNGDHMWDKLISKYENVYLVMSGHDPSKNVVVTQTEGEHGNIVTQILSDHQGVDTSVPTGMVTMLYFKANGEIEVETYSTIQECYYLEENQISIKESEHSFTENEQYAYPNGYMQSGMYSVECAYCDKIRGVELEPIVTLKGYSVREGYSAICVGYNVNHEAKTAYEAATGKTIDLGVVACASANLANGDNKPIKPNGNVAEVVSGKIAKSIVDSTMSNVILVVDAPDWRNYASLEMLLCMYVIEDERVSYLCDQVEDSASPITYTQIVERITQKGGNV